MFTFVLKSFLYSEEQRKLDFDELQEKIDAETRGWWKDIVRICVYVPCTISP